MSGPTDLASMVPGFDFLQGLLKNAGAGLPNLGQWIAPTLNPEELEKRIQELKTVHFWLEQNAKLLGTTIQALEVQRMTLSTLQGMNMPLAGLAESLKIKMPVMPAPKAAAEDDGNDDSDDSDENDEVQRSAPAPQRKPAARKTAAPAKAAAAAIDPMQWWGALTQQFTELASKAVKDSAADTAKSLAGAMVKSSLNTATGALKKAASVPATAARAARASRASRAGPAAAAPAPARRKR